MNEVIERKSQAYIMRQLGDSHIIDGVASHCFEADVTKALTGREAIHGCTPVCIMCYHLVLCL